MKPKKKVARPPITVHRKAPAVPVVVFEYVVMQLILRGSGFKSSELATIIKECKDNPKRTSVHMVVTREFNGRKNRHMFGVGTINYSLKLVQIAWTKWLTVASESIIKKFEVWQKKSIAYASMEAILSSLAEAGFEISESPIEETFDLTGTIH